MNITPLHPDPQSLRSAEPGGADSPATDPNPFLGEVFRVMARAAPREAATRSDRGDLASSAAEVIRAVWNGDVRAETYELSIVRTVDVDDLNGS